MFYVTGVKIYLMELDELLKVYREVHIVDGRPVALNTGTPTKPAVRTVLTLDEIVAKLADKGIIASLHDELNDPAYGAYGPNPGIAVRVFKKDYEQSQHILKGISDSRSELLPFCPHCGSEKIRVLEKSVRKRPIFAVLLGIVLIILGSSGLVLPIFLESLGSMRVYALIISPFVLLGGVLLVLPQGSHQHYLCTECGKEFKK